MVGALAVFGFALLTALATGVGAWPLAFARGAPRRWLGMSNAVAAGSMAAASVGLLLEGFHSDVGRALAGAVLGGVFVAGFQRMLQGRGPEMAGLRRRDVARMLAIVAVMTIHSFTEGVGVGVSFGDGQSFGVYVTAAIAIHNIPEGLAISLVMVPRGASVKAAALWSVVSSLPQPLMAVPAFLLVAHFRAMLPLGLGFAAGAMLWMVARELVPEALRDAPLAPATASFAGAAGVMGALQLLLA